MRNSFNQRSSNQIQKSTIHAKTNRHKFGLLAVSCLIVGASVCGGTGATAFAADGTSGAASADISAQVQALAAQIAHLSSKVQSDPVASKAVAPVLSLINSPSFSWDQVLFGTDSPTGEQMAIAQALTPSMRTLAQFNVTSQSAAASIVSTIVQQVGAVEPRVPATDVIAFIQAVEGQSMVNLLPLSAMPNPTVANVESAMHSAVVQSSSSIASVQAVLSSSASGSTSGGGGNSTGTGSSGGGSSTGGGAGGSGSGNSTGGTSTGTGSAGGSASSGNTTSGSGGKTNSGTGTTTTGGSNGGTTKSGSGTGSNSGGSTTATSNKGSNSGSTAGSGKGTSGNKSGNGATEGATPTKGIVLTNGKFGANQQGILINGKLVSVAPSITQNKTTYVPLWYVMHALNSLHIQSKWNGKSWSMTTTSKLNIDWKKVKPGKGNVEIYLNGHLIQRVNGLTAKDKNTGNKTTFVPISYVAQVLKSMHIQSDWNGSTWNLKH